MTINQVCNQRLNTSQQPYFSFCDYLACLATMHIENQDEDENYFTSFIDLNLFRDFLIQFLISLCGSLINFFIHNNNYYI